MGITYPKVLQDVFDKMADWYDDVRAAEARTEGFFECISRPNQEDIETDLGVAAETADANWGGYQFYGNVTALLTAIRTHVREVGGYATLNAYLAAKRYRVPRQMADRCWADSGVGTALLRAHVFTEPLALSTFVHGGAFAVAAAIAATAGAARIRCLVGAAKGATIWTPNVHAPCEGPATTLSAALTAGATTVSLTDATNFAESGHAHVGTEAIAYTGKTGNDLTGCTRAALGTTAASHASGATVYALITYTPIIRASAVEGLLVDLDVSVLEDVAVAGTAEVPSVGASYHDWLVGNYALIKDHSCPELLTADCSAAAIVRVADASAFTAGDHVLLHDNTPNVEWATIHNVDYHDNIIYLDAATAAAYTTAQSAFIALAYSTLSEGAELSAVDATITLADATGLPTAGTVRIVGGASDEEVTYTGVAGNDLTGCGRGANDTTATAHADGSVVVLVQRGTWPGHNEWHTIYSVLANSLILSENLRRTYYTAAYIVPLVRSVVLAEDGSGGSAGDPVTFSAQPDRLVEHAG